MNVSNFNPSERRTRIRTASSEAKTLDKAKEESYFNEIEGELDREFERLLRIEKKIQQLVRKRDEIEQLVKDFRSGVKISPSFSIPPFEF